MKESNHRISVSISLESIGFICWLVFLILKLTNVIDWNWFWIWFPLWSPLLIDALFGIVTLIVVINLDDN